MTSPSENGLILPDTTNSKTTGGPPDVDALADPDDRGVTVHGAAGRVEDRRGLVLRHGAGRASGPAFGQVHQFGHIPADEVVLLRPPDGTAERALDHH